MKNQYIYSGRVLKDIAANYVHLYEGIEFNRNGFYHHTDVNPWSIAEYKADFDLALNSIGRGYWIGEIKEFKDYYKFSKLQRIVIADIIGEEDRELERMGFYRMPQMKGYAYHLMADRLNGELHHGTKTQFKAKPLDIVCYA